MLVYKITNNINGKVYIGQTIHSIKRRWQQHVCDAKRSKMLISKSIKKYGAENFTIEEIGGANNQSELNYQEWLLIYRHNTMWPNGYNMMEGGGARGKAGKSTKEKLSKIRREWHKTKKNPRAKKVINIKTGETWDSAKICWEKSGMQISYSTFKGKLSGFDGNQTNFRYLGEENSSKPYVEQNRKVINIKTKEIFTSISEAARKNNINRITLNYKLLNPNKNNTNFKYFNGSC